jgi:hypothetical protein
MGVGLNSQDKSGRTFRKLLEDRPSINKREGAKDVKEDSKPTESIRIIDTTIVLIITLQIACCFVLLVIEGNILYSYLTTDNYTTRSKILIFNVTVSFFMLVNNSFNGNVQVVKLSRL